LKAENIILDEKNKGNEIIIAKMKEQTKRLYIKQWVLKRQLQKVETKRNDLETEKKVAD